MLKRIFPWQPSDLFSKMFSEHLWCSWFADRHPNRLLSTRSCISYPHESNFSQGLPLYIWTREGSVGSKQNDHPIQSPRVKFENMFKVLRPCKRLIQVDLFANTNWISTWFFPRLLCVSTFNPIHVSTKEMKNASLQNPLTIPQQEI